MLWHKNKMPGKNSYAKGCDFSCKPCSECGGYPIRVDYNFSVKGKGITTVFRGQKKTVDLECRSYYHCPCGHSTTDWHRPVRDENGVIIKEAWELARKAYETGKFVKAKKIKIT